MTDQVLSQTHETQVQELSLDQLEHVAAGTSTGAIAMGDGSVRLGDFNADGRVDAADYVVWRKTLG